MKGGSAGSEDAGRRPRTVGELLDTLVDEVVAGLDGRDPASTLVFTNWHPRHVGRSAEEVLASTIGEADVRLAVARSLGFADSAAARAARRRRFAPRFETAADAVVGGDVAGLSGLLDARPSLARERSPLGHAATLLHYVAANGVELHRQLSPPSSAAIAERLLQAGAEVDALAQTYGGGSAQTTLTLLLTSGFPWAAGVGAAVLEALLRHGADPDGVDGDGAPEQAARRTGNTAALVLLAAARAARSLGGAHD